MDVERLTGDRTVMKKLVSNMMSHMENWERQRAISMNGRTEN